MELDEKTTPTTLEESEVLATENTSEKPKKVRKELKGILQILAFLGFSILAGVLDLGSFTLVSLIKWVEHPEVITTIATVTGIVLSCTFNLLCNRKFTFGATTNLLVCFIGYAILYGILAPVSAAIVNWLVYSHAWDETLAKFSTMVMNLACEFLFIKFFLYRLDGYIAKFKQNRANKTNNNK